MKKILLLLAVVAFSATSFAQDVQFGVKGGLNISKFRGDDIKGDARTDIYLGGFARIGLTETLDFQPELVYSRQGMKTDVADSKWKSSYLNIPLLLRAELFGVEELHALAGPQIGIHLSSDIDSDAKVFDGGVNDAMKGMDLSLALGFEYDITEKIAVGIRYNLGLSNIADEEGADAKNSVFQLGVSVAF